MAPASTSLLVVVVVCVPIKLYAQGPDKKTLLFQNMTSEVKMSLYTPRTLNNLHERSQILTVLSGHNL